MKSEEDFFPPPIPRKIHASSLNGKMICDHQLCSADETDWIFSTSASSLLGGSTTAKRILQELFRKRHDHMIKSENIKRKKRAVTTESTYLNSGPNPPSGSKRFSETKSWSEPLREGGEDFLIIRNQGISNFENFDASQHLNGCPVKWLYNKRLSDRNKKYRISRRCSKKSGEKKETKKGKVQNFRDKTPVEVKIHKINLIDKCMCKNDENHFPPFKSSSSSLPPDKSAILEPLESHKKKLAAKLHWKFHDETQQDGGGLEASSDISSRQNYLPPRPLLGLKPLLSILLSPHQEICCNVATHFLQNSSRERKTESPSLTVQSLDLPSFVPESKSRPKTTNTPRWGSKSSRLQKRLQIPNQITINLRQAAEIPRTKTDSNNLQGRKITRLPKCQPSLSSLFYELSDKTKNLQPLEDLIKDLMMEDDHFKIKRFLHYNCETSILAPLSENKRNQEKKMRTTENESTTTTTSTDETGLNLICHGVRLSNKSSRPKRMTQRERHASVKINL